MAADTLAVFDFDDTLFKSPDPPPGIPPTHEEWWANEVSLSPPHVPERPGSAFWYGNVVRAAKRAISDSSTHTVLITGRYGGNKALKERVHDILASGGLRFDEVYMNPSWQPTGQWKLGVYTRLLGKLPQIRSVEAWEDRADILHGYNNVAVQMDLDFQPHLMNLRESVVRYTNRLRALLSA